MDESTFGTCRIEMGDEAHEVDFSDTTDAIGDLLRAMVQIVCGATVAVCAFDREPGQWIWNFARRYNRLGPAEAKIQVMDSRSAGRNAFELRAPIDDLARALLTEVDRLGIELGADGYKDLFEMPFPDRPVAALRAALERPGR